MNTPAEAVEAWVVPGVGNYDSAYADAKWGVLYARQAYISGRIDVEEFERRVGEALGLTATVPLDKDAGSP